MAYLFGVYFEDDEEYDNALLEIMVELEHTTREDFDDIYTIDENDLKRDIVHYCDDMDVWSDDKLIAKIIKALVRATNKPTEVIREEVLSFIKEMIEEHLEENINEDEALKHFIDSEKIDENVSNARLSDDKKNIYYEVMSYTQNIDKSLNFRSEESMEESNSYQEFHKDLYGFYPFDECEQSVKNKKNEMIYEKTERTMESIESGLSKLLEDYQEVSTDANLTVSQKIRGINNTIQIVKKAVPGINTNTLDYIINKPTDIKRPTKQKSFLKHIQDAKVHTILKDSKGNIYYPFIADLLIAPYILTIAYNEKKEGIQALQKAIEALGNEAIKLEIKTQIELMFIKTIQLNQIKRYTLEYFVNHYNLDYDSLRIVFRQLLCANPQNQKNFLLKQVGEITPPNPLVDITPYTSKISHK